MQRHGRNRIKQIRPIHFKKTKNPHHHKPIRHRNRKTLRQPSTLPTKRTMQPHRLWQYHKRQTQVNTYKYVFENHKSINRFENINSTFKAFQSSSPKSPDFGTALLTILNNLISTINNLYNNSKWLITLNKNYGT